MSKYNMERALRRELEELNERIDRKIIRGQSYKKEAARHKIIHTELLRIRRSESILGLKNFFSVFRPVSSL